MNTENLEFLQDNLKYLGFGDKLFLNQQLTEKIAGAPKSFELDTEAFFDENHKLEVTMYFRRSDQLDMYFFNKYEATLRSGEDSELDRAQTFYINKGSGVTLKEAFNLLQGRAVNKDLVSMEGQKYNAWIQLNFGEKDLHNNYKVKQYRAQYGYDLEKTLEKYPIRELGDAELRAALLRSLRKGNQHTVSFDKSTKTEKMFIEANPQFKTINIYSTARVLSARSGGKSQTEWNEEEKEEVAETKEEEAEIAGNKQPARKKIQK